MKAFFLLKIYKDQNNLTTEDTEVHRENILLLSKTSVYLRVLCGEDFFLFIFTLLAMLKACLNLFLL